MISLRQTSRLKTAISLRKIEDDCIKETKVNIVKMKWTMIDQRLRQENICLPNRLTVLGTYAHASDSTNVIPSAQHQPSHQRMLILSIFAIELTVSSLFGLAFKLKSRKFYDFNDEIIVFGNVFDLQYDFDCNYDALITLMNETIGVMCVSCTSINFLSKRRWIN